MHLRLETYVAAFVGMLQVHLLLAAATEVVTLLLLALLCWYLAWVSCFSAGILLR